MQNELLITTLIILAFIAVLFFLIRKNKKDKIDVEDHLKKNYKRPKKTRTDIETEGLDSV